MNVKYVVQKNIKNVILGLLYLFQGDSISVIDQVINVVGSIRTVPLTASNTNKQVLFQQKAMFSTGTPVAAATVAPILSTNSIPSTTGQGKYLVSEKYLISFWTLKIESC